MRTNARPLATAGVAIVGAGLLAVTPITATNGDTMALRASDQSVALTAAFSPTASPESLLSMTAGRLLEQIRQAPLVPTVMLLAAVGGDTQRLYSQTRQVIDMPLYVLDPTFEAVANGLPAGIGGGTDHDTSLTAGDGEIMKFRNQIQAAQTELRNGIADSLGVVPGGTLGDTNYAWTASNLLLKSGIDSASLAVQIPMALVKLTEAVVSGESAENVYKIARDIVDGPQWAIDSGIDGVATILPKSLGGGTDYVRGVEGPEDGALLKFRNKEMLGLRNQVRVGVAGLVGADTVDKNGILPGESGYTPPVTTMSLRTADADSGSDLRAQLSKQTEKLVTGDNSSVKKRVNEVKGIAKDVGSLKLDSAGKKAGTVVTARVQQAGQDLENGVKKVRETVKKTFSKKDSGDQS